MPKALARRADAAILKTPRFRRERRRKAPSHEHEGKRPTTSSGSAMAHKRLFISPRSAHHHASAARSIDHTHADGWDVGVLSILSRPPS